MHVLQSSDTLGSLPCAIAVPIPSESPLIGVAKELDALLGGAIADILASGEFKGKIGESTLLHAASQPFKRVLLVGLGDAAAFSPSVMAKVAGTAVRVLGKRGATKIAIAFPPQASGDEERCASFAAEGAIAGSFETGTYQSAPERPIAVGEAILLANGFNGDAVGRGLKRGVAIGEAVNLARRLALTPANDMTPTHLAAEATALAKAHGMEIEVHDAAWAAEKKMGSFLSVAQGSAQPPAFIVMHYRGAPQSDRLLALVGKGITFDTGGISLKPPEKMEEMKYDMSGGAGVIAAMGAIAALKPKINVVGIVPATENMPGGKATKPGDIVRASNGTTIEVINTDAEGRLVLADALVYARSLNATQIVDAATLTGACVIALGHAASAAVSNDDAFATLFLDAAKDCGERYWRMPLYDDYSNAMKSDIADLKNTGGRPAGTLTAAAFLKAFVEKTPWIHLDVAGTAYVDGETAWSAKGPTGTPVRAFVHLAEKMAE